MSRHQSTETFNLDLRSSPSQQHLDPTSRSSSLPSQQGGDDMMMGDHHNNGQQERSHKVDLYSIPVFLLEVLVLIGLAYSAYYVHFEYNQEPFITGFYCDDIAYRQQFTESAFTQQFSEPENEFKNIALLLIVPITLIVFCELVNSMFGALKFRQIRALCKCCKLHSITRRTIRFSGAYALGFLILMISCDTLAITAGRLRPYFAQDCPSAYKPCISSSSSTLQRTFNNGRSGDSMAPLQQQSTPSTTTTTGVDTSGIMPASQPISSPQIMAVAQQLMMPSRPILETQIGGDGSAILRAPIVERVWVDLTGQNLRQICQFTGLHTSDLAEFKFNQLAKSWPSFPAAMFTYACLYISCYLCFVGTARPFRIITSALVMVLLLVATIFNVTLVQKHYHHWEDVAASAFFALVVVIFILFVYLNKFKDTHYYENQKLFKSKVLLRDGSFSRAYNGDGLIGQHSLDKTNGSGGAIMHHETALQNGGEQLSASNNDLAMRYFQIPRANYRGAPRPLSSINQMR